MGDKRECGYTPDYSVAPRETTGETIRVLRLNQYRHHPVQGEEPHGRRAADVLTRTRSSHENHRRFAGE